MSTYIEPGTTAVGITTTDAVVTIQENGEYTFIFNFMNFIGLMFLKNLFIEIHLALSINSAN